ncbi:MAG: hypothetical protein HOL85_17995 [Rhodospirillaceae bacterium]|nr:hypothetical protein [Rhodospirillaceae bacterium]MBT6138699.1 hypothetical protein [Rhodospirillaceae bacterium]
MSDEDEGGYWLRLFKDKMPAGASVTAKLSANPRVLYCNAGRIVVSDGTVVEADQAWFGTGTVSWAVDDDGAAEVWRWELTPLDVMPEPDLGTGIVTDQLSGDIISTIAPTEKWLMRCDSVRFPPSGVALLHTHQGPGIRCLREGGIRIDSGGHSHKFAPGEAWFEDGREPVFAAAAEEGCTSFIRVMILPAELKGKSSIQYVNEEDLDKPKTQRYKGYVDECIDH